MHWHIISLKRLQTHASIIDCCTIFGSSCLPGMHLVKSLPYTSMLAYPAELLLYFLLTVKAAPHECVIRTGQP